MGQLHPPVTELRPEAMPSVTTTETGRRGNAIGDGVQPVAWNGIRLAVPSAWEIGQIGRRYLLMVAGSNPVLEIKWGRAGRRYAHEKQIRRLAELQRPVLRRALQPWQPPHVFADTITAYSSAGFTWEDKGHTGHGFSLLCPTCRQATLLQFTFDIAAEKETVRSILASFRDHSDDGSSLWRLYGLVAALPAGFDLTTFRLEAGRIRLAFSRRRTRVDLFRWGAARTLLKGDNLAAFAALQPELALSPRHPLTTTPTPDGSRVEWCVEGRRLLPWWRNTGSRGRLWHLDSKNRILGIHIHGGQGRDAALLESICDDFSTI